jgi:hypothetical protein
MRQRRLTVGRAGLVLLIVTALLGAGCVPKYAGFLSLSQESSAESAASCTRLESSSERAELAPTTSQLSSPEAATVTHVVVIVLDAARPDYFTVPNIPHVQALMQNGTQYPNAWAGILESVTPSGHAALATGSNPCANGILSFGWINEDDDHINLFDPKAVRAGEMEEVMAEAGTPTIASLVHRNDPNATVVALSGHKYYAADSMGGPDADAIMYYEGTRDGRFVPTFIPGHEPPDGVLSAPGLSARSTDLPLGVGDHLAMRLAATSFERMKQRVTLFNLPEFDWPLSHVLGGSRDWNAVTTLMQGFDRDLGMLQETYRKAGVLDRTLFVITADHGTAPIYYSVPKETIREAVQASGAEISSDAYHTGAFVWLENETHAKAAAERIAQLQNPRIQSVYFREMGSDGPHYIRASDAGRFHVAEMEAANQYLLNTFNGPNGPDVVAFYTRGTANLSGPTANWKGDHGGADWESQHIPLILSGPGVRSGHFSTYPARLADIAPTVLSSMGIRSDGMDGYVLADALEAAPQGATDLQNEESKRLLPLVEALRTQFRYEMSIAQ